MRRALARQVARAPNSTTSTRDYQTMSKISPPTAAAKPETTERPAYSDIALEYTERLRAAGYSHLRFDFAEMAGMISERLRVARYSPTELGYVIALTTALVFRQQVAKDDDEHESSLEEVAGWAHRWVLRLETDRPQHGGDCRDLL